VPSLHPPINTFSTPSAKGCGSTGTSTDFEGRWAEGRSERFPELAGELIRLKPGVILTVSVPAALAAKNGTTTIPIVFIATDRLGLGLVPSLARPGGNLKPQGREVAQAASQAQPDSERGRCDGLGLADGDQDR
jgi:ABC-type uncharacterized transport system substrate-binding protein